jgi:membrane-associated protein
MPPFIEFLLHLDEHVSRMIVEHGPWTYSILFAIIFAETGLVFLPFLPGDSLLFAVGMFCHPEKPGLDYWKVFGLLTTAAFLGDNVNYQVGKRFGARLFRNENSKFFKQSYLKKTNAYFEKHGGLTLILARFVPIVRTFAPFVAGMGSMTFPRFLVYSALGGVIWVGVCLTSGYLFGQIPVVRENFEFVLLGVIVLSVIPMILKVRKAKKESQMESMKNEEYS